MARHASRSWYRIVNKADGADDAVRVYIYDFIGEDWWDPERGVSARKFVQDFKSIDAAEIHVHINSPGGLVFDGMAIANAIKQHPARCVVHIDGLAASIASVIAVAGDEVRMAANAFVMIHDPVDLCWGTAEEMRKTADTLDKLRTTIGQAYADKSGQERAKFEAMMAEETWFTADEAREAGLIDAIEEESDEGVSMTAAAVLMRSSRMPEGVRRALNQRNVSDASSFRGVPGRGRPDVAKEASMAKNTDVQPGEKTDPVAEDGVESAETRTTTTETAGGDGAGAATTGEPAATFEQLNAMVAPRVPGRNDFIMACLSGRLSLTQATAKLQEHILAHAEKLAKESEERIGRIEAKMKDLEKVAPAAGGGVKPLNLVVGGRSGGGVAARDGGARYGGDPALAFEARQRENGPAANAFFDRVNEVAAELRCSKDDAIRHVQKHHRDLLDAYTAEANEARRRRQEARRAG